MTFSASRCDLPVRLDAGLWFRYAGQKQDDVVFSCPFDATLCSERSSTTRFLAWPGHAAWARLHAGDLVRFWDDKERRGRSLVVRLTAIAPLDLAECDEDALQAWNRAQAAPKVGAPRRDEPWVVSPAQGSGSVMIWSFPTGRPRCARHSSRCSKAMSSDPPEAPHQDAVAWYERHAADQANLYENNTRRRACMPTSLSRHGRPAS